MIGTVEQLKSRINTSGGGASQNDDLLEDMLKASSDRFITEASDRTLEPLGDDTPYAMTFETRGSIVPVPDLREVVSVTLNEDPLPSLSYRLTYEVGRDADRRYMRVRLANGYVCDRPDGFLTRLVITGKWGPAEVEPRVEDAVLTWAARAYHQRTARFADAVQDPNGGTVSSYFRHIPADVAGVLNSLVIPGL